MARVFVVAALTLVLALALPAAHAQFQFNPGTYDASQLYIQISGFYNSYASIWSMQLAQAKSSLPGAYAELTSIFNTDDIPDSFDPAFVSHLAQEMVIIGHTTVVDPQIAASTLVFTQTTATAGSAASASATSTPALTTAVLASSTRPTGSLARTSVALSSNKPSGSLSKTTSGSALPTTPPASSGHASDSDVFTFASLTTATTKQSGASSDRHASALMDILAMIAFAFVGALCLL
ncbi:hypothetical protein GGI04_004164 [Coemansia thaxteri]|nr:hypothetical protein GGI04_004164 [Coemansia thaxteri]